MKTEVV